MGRGMLALLAVLAFAGGSARAQTVDGTCGSLSPSAAPCIGLDKLAEAAAAECRRIGLPAGPRALPPRAAGGSLRAAARAPRRIEDRRPLPAHLAPSRGGVPVPAAARAAAATRPVARHAQLVQQRERLADDLAHRLEPAALALAAARRGRPRARARRAFPAGTRRRRLARARAGRGALRLHD